MKESKSIIIKDKTLKINLDPSIEALKVHFLGIIIQSEEFKDMTPEQAAIEATEQAKLYLEWLKKADNESFRVKRIG